MKILAADRDIFSNIFSVFLLHLQTSLSLLYNSCGFNLVDLYITVNIYNTIVRDASDFMSISVYVSSMCVFGMFVIVKGRAHHLQRKENKFSQRSGIISCIIKYVIMVILGVLHWFFCFRSIIYSTYKITAVVVVGCRFMLMLMLFLLQLLFLFSLYLFWLLLLFCLCCC